jgi:hypothetical protein
MFLALLISAIALLAPRKASRPPERRLEHRDPLVERRKDDDVGGEGG